MKKWIKAEDGKVTQVVEFDSGSKIELPLDKNGNLKWFDDTKLIKKSQGDNYPLKMTIVVKKQATTRGVKVQEL